MQSIYNLQHLGLSAEAFLLKAAMHNARNSTSAQTSFPVFINGRGIGLRRTTAEGIESGKVHEML